MKPCSPCSTSSFALAAILASVLPVAAPVSAEETSSAREAASPAPEVSPPAPDVSAPETEPPKPDPCAPPPESDELWAARMRRSVFRTVCNAASWVDSAFGDPRSLPLNGGEESEDAVNGRLFFGMGYDELDGFDPSVKLRAKIPLPLLRNRVNALVGRTEVDDFASDRDESFDRLPDALREADDEWLLGLGYNPVRTTRFRLDFDAGVRVDFPLDPFVRGRMRQVVLLNERQLIRLRQTVFWRNAKGFGVTSAADFERIFAKNLLVRSSVSGTLAQETAGVEYTASVTLFQNLDRIGALAYKALVLGQTDAPVAVEEYGLVLIHRRRFLRDWLFMEIAPGVGWRRERPEEPREMVGSVRFGLEMLFGNERKAR